MKKAIRNRIVGYGDVDIDSVVFNEKNWRIHPKNQQDGLSGILEDVGLVLGVLINKRTDPSWGAASQGVETLIDGHLRVTLADRAGEKTIPVTYVDLTEKEEAEILATLDPIGAMAATDKQKLDELLRDIDTGNEEVMKMLENMAAREGLLPPIDPSKEWEGMPEFHNEDQTGIKAIIHFETEQNKQAFEQLVGQKIPDNTHAIWYPKKAWADMKSSHYESES